LHGTLGTLDPTSDATMLVTWDSRGAAIERVELNSPRYKSVEDLSGYLGHLALTDAKSGGAEVNVVGPGTPAALAKSAGSIGPGLIVGDVIEKIDSQDVADAATVTTYLETRTRPRQSITLVVRRKDLPQPIEFTAVLVRRPMEIVRPEDHAYRTPTGGVEFFPADQPSLLLSLDSIAGRGLRPAEDEIPGLPSLRDANWKVDARGPDFVEFSVTLDAAALARLEKTGALKIIKRYTLAKADKPGERASHLDLQVSIRNEGEEPLPIAYRLDGPTGLPLEGWWYSTKLHPEMWSGAGARDVAYKQAGLGHRLMGNPEIITESKKLLAEKKPQLIGLLEGDGAATLDYIGVDTQFFASAILPQPISENQPIKFRSADAMPVQLVTAIPKTRLKTADISFRLTTSPTTIAPGAALTHDYQVFFGPKESNLLAEYGLDRFIEFGWPIFKWPAILLQKILEILHAITRNYGIAIILLTVIVRSCMLPISLKQARSAAKMQELAPEMQRVKDKFPDDPMKQHAAVQELYKRHNFNPFGGCLLVFFQLPIFIGLYRCLSVDIDLRDASLIPSIAWASNLAGPDKLFYWRDWMPTFIGDEADGWLGPFFNVLPLITVALFLVQQKMFTPPATDEQTKMQQQMMTYMTVFMGVMFYKVPAGLCLYFITSSLWGICERKLLPKPKPGGGESATVSLPAKSVGTNGSTKPGGRKQKQKR
jgi:YidC/Oxa1 family membrane protein insertase